MLTTFSRRVHGVCAAALGAAMLCAVPAMADPMTIEDLAKIRSVTGAVVSPDGQRVAYTLATPRDVLKGEEDGPAHRHLYIAGDEPGDGRAFVTAKSGVGGVQWTPDGTMITFRAKRDGDTHGAVYGIPVDGGEATRLFAHSAGIGDYLWADDGDRLFFVATDKADPVEKQLKEKGFKARIYEEDIPFGQVWSVDLTADEPAAEPLPLEGHASSIELSPDGEMLAVVLAPTPLVDDSLMSQRIHLVSVDDPTQTTVIDTPGKIGPYRFSPDGEHLAFLAAIDRADPTAGTLMIADIGTGAYEALDAEAQAHVMDLEWLDNTTVLGLQHRGVQSALMAYGLDGSVTERVVHEDMVAFSLDLATPDGILAMTASAPDHPFALYLAQSDLEARKWTAYNTWLEERDLAAQTVVRYEARDGVEIEGLLITPNGRKPRRGWPLIMVVHGGPEAHYSNSWLTGYSSGGQIAAGEGFALFYPNYRGSTGRGTAFAKLDHLDPPAAEFNDVVDAIGVLAEDGLIDETKVGITGGSYGGYASAWGATALSEHFAASVAFVALTDLVSFGGTTDIPVEMVDVHFMEYPWEDWQRTLESSPIYHAGNSKTPTLILHGEADPRVHPAQSLELYRYLKLRSAAPVRLVTYPGEGHGNRMAAARIDYAKRLMRWMTHYLKGPGGEPPAADLGLAETLGLETGEGED